MKPKRNGSASPSQLEARVVSQLVNSALEEDLGEPISLEADITAQWVIGDDDDRTMKGRILSRQQGVVAGLDLAIGVFERLDPQARVQPSVADGNYVSDEETILELHGNARSLVVAERTALNFLQRLGGIATITRHFVDAVQGTQARITDTRKTTPGLRRAERHAVLCGGGVSHRFNLTDAVLIKENHVTAAGGAATAVQRALHGAQSAGRPETLIMCETETLDQVRELLSLGEPAWPDRILLDNMSDEVMSQAVEIIRHEAGQQIAIEATGGVELSSVRAIAGTGVDLISIGALTHSAPAMDMSLLFEEA